MIPGVGDREDAMQVENNGLLDINDLIRFAVNSGGLLILFRLVFDQGSWWVNDVRVVLVVSFLDLGLFR